jgi:UDP-3-O-acyl N-acetylglucosamine deacetylase
MRFNAAEPGTGIVFRRMDLAGKPIVLACTSNRRDTALRTTLISGLAKVEMVEHVMAALYALRIDNCLIDVTASEMPGLDGSAFPYVCALLQAGLEVQAAKRPIVSIENPVRLGTDSNWIMALPAETDILSLEYQLDYGTGSPIGGSTFACSLDPGSFVEGIASARTFLTSQEAQMLQSKGLATHVTYRDLLVFGPSGPIDNSLRFPDECARHKMLDLIGDLALAGVDLAGRVVACRSGHNLNGQLASTLVVRKPKPLVRSTAA